jgi:hypothetical protein
MPMLKSQRLLPTVPPKRWHWTCFVCSAVFTLMAIFIVWSAQERGWLADQLLWLTIEAFVPSVIFLVAGLMFRARYTRLKLKRSAVTSALIKSFAES